MRKINIKSTKSIVIVFFTLICATVFFAIATSGKGAQIVAIEREIASLEQENRELESHIVAHNSLRKIADEAANSGLIKDTKILYWNQDLSVATLP